jgi:hypothetical protein
MRRVAVLVLTVALVCSTASARQAPSGAAAGGGAINACAFLPKDLALKVTGTNKALFDLPPRETPVGKGSECNYGDIQLRIDPFSWASLKGRMNNGPKWTVVSGVGDEAYFRDNGRFAEFMGHVGSRTFTIQMGVPVTSTAEKIKPNVITLASAIVPKLK